VPPIESVIHSVEATDPLDDADVVRVLTTSPNEVPRPRQVFCNRNLRMDQIELVGFDMDYTLAIYHAERMERLSFEMTVQKMIRERGYPEKFAQSHYDPSFVIRGLLVDKTLGNLMKPDRYDHVGRAYHGRRPLSREEKRAYREEKVRLSSDRYGWIDTLFALPEACLYAEAVELLEAAGQRVDYGKLYVDIRECIDAVHRDGTLKSVVQKDLARYVALDSDLGPTLHKLRSGGKKIFLLTNSLWDYTDAVMKCLLDRMLPEYPSWRNYFDYLVVGAAKPGFFSGQSPFIEIDPVTGKELGEAKTLERGRVYQGGNLVDLERRIGIGGERVLYVGDHIYGDILRSKKTSLWRTCMVIPELEEEIAYIDRQSGNIGELIRLEAVRARLDEEINVRKLALNTIERKLEKEADPAARHAVDDERRAAKTVIEKLRRALKFAVARVKDIEDRLEGGSNAFWGLLFKEGTENSRFGQQVEQYACIYTGRVSNLHFYSPTQYFRSFRDAMPHERQDGNPRRFLGNGSEPHE
jgi:5'-nucleotidase